MKPEFENQTYRIMVEGVLEKRRQFNPNYPWSTVADLMVASLVSGKSQQTLKQATELCGEAEIDLPEGYSLKDILETSRPWLKKSDVELG